MQIDTPNFGTVELTNFIDLPHEALNNILHMRNHIAVRTQMHNSSPITEYEHFNFVKLLKSNDSKKYFAVSISTKMVGVIYFTDIDSPKDTTTFGIYANLIDKIPKSGSILMETGIVYFNNCISCNKLFLEVYESNKRAINLYFKYGFIQKNTIKKDSENIIVMELSK